MSSLFMTSAFAENVIKSSSCTIARDTTDWREDLPPSTIAYLEKENALLERKGYQVIANHKDATYVLSELRDKDPLDFAPGLWQLGMGSLYYVSFVVSNGNKTIVSFQKDKRYHQDKSAMNYRFKKMEALIPTCLSSN